MKAAITMTAISNNIKAIVLFHIKGLCGIKSAQLFLLNENGGGYRKNSVKTIDKAFRDSND